MSIIQYNCDFTVGVCSPTDLHRINNLRMVDGKAICQYCFNNSPSIIGDWHDLDKFVPELDEQVDHLESMLVALEAQFNALQSRLAMIENKFKSNNSVPVDRIVVKASEWYDTRNAQ